MFLGQEANCGGQCDGVDLVSVSDEKGRFFLASEKKFDTMDIRVTAPGFAPMKFFRLGSGPEHDLKLTEGVLVNGRVTREGQAVKGAGVGLVSIDRSDHSTGNFDTFTDEEGRFAFANVPPYHMYYVYTLMDKTPEGLVSQVRRLRVTGDGTQKDAGDLALSKGVRLSGHVLLADGKPVPDGTELYVGRETAWDGRSVKLGANATFAVTAVPGEALSLGVRVKGYRLSDKNKSLDRLNGGGLIGRVDRDTDVTILLEPGEFQQPALNGRITPDMQPRDKPLEGAPVDTTG